MKGGDAALPKLLWDFLFLYLVALHDKFYLNQALTHLFTVYVIGPRAEGLGTPVLSGKFLQKYMPVVNEFAFGWNTFSHSRDKATVNSKHCPETQPTTSKLLRSGCTNLS